MKKKIIDANYILRYLLCDNQEQNIIATQIIENEQVVLLNEVLAEVCYVLEKVYGVSKKEISQIIGSLITFDNIAVDQELISKALLLYNENNLDFVDALLISYSYIKGAHVYSFDKKLNKMMKR